MIKQKKIILLLMAVLFVGVYAVPVLSDEGHGHKEKESSNQHGHQAPHGGKMVTVGSHHAEVVVENGNIIKIYLYDGKDQPAPIKNVSGQIHLTFPDNHRETLELEPSANQTHLEARVKDKSHSSFKAVLSLVIDGQRQNIRLRL